MAVLNINANSSGNISISGTSTKTGTISWTAPSLPSVATITSCTLTGKATISMTRGTGTCTVNGTSVTNGQTFTINLNSGVSSVSVSCRGSNYQARGTVSFSNLVYTVNYTMDYSSLNHIATYKFNNTMYDLIPYFEDGFNYGYVCDDTVEGNLTTRRLYSEALPQYMCFGSEEGSDDRTNSLYEIDYLNTSNLVSMYCMFADCTNLHAINDCNWDTRNVTSMSGMFYNCAGLTSLDLTSWDVSNVVDMSWMFENCYDLQTLNLANWDTGSVTTMEGMFVKDVHLISVDTTNWDTSNVIDMSYMFGKANYGKEYPGCDSLEEIIGIEDWDVSNVQDMASMFYGAYKLKSLDLNKWVTSNVIDMSVMFCAAGYKNPEFSLNINMWDVSNVVDMDYMFDCCTTLKELDLSGWDVSNVTNMAWMFGNDDADDSMQLTKLNLSGWTFNNTVNMSNMFSYTNRLNEIKMNSDISSINKIISVLPTRTSNSMGTLNIVGINDISQVDTSTAQSKYWNMVGSVEPEEDFIEWTGVGTVASDLTVDTDWEYRINVDWETQYLLFRIEYNFPQVVGETINLAWINANDFLRISCTRLEGNNVRIEIRRLNSGDTLRYDISLMNNINSLIGSYVSIIFKSDNNGNGIVELEHGSTIQGVKTFNIPSPFYDQIILYNDENNLINDDVVYDSIKVLEKRIVTDNIIEWTGSGTVVTNCSNTDRWIYKLYDIDWDNQYVELNITAGMDTFQSVTMLYLWHEEETNEHCTCMFEIDDESNFVCSYGECSDINGGDTFIARFSKNNRIELIKGEQVVATFNDNNELIGKPTFYIGSLSKAGLGVESSPLKETVINYMKVINIQEGPIEWTGVGTVATGLKNYVNHNDYHIDIDWDTQYLDIVITNIEVRFPISFDSAKIGNIIVNNKTYDIGYYGSVEIYT